MPVRPRDLVSFCVRGFPGTNRALANLAANTGSRHFTLASGEPGGPEIRFFLELLREQLPRTVLFGGWSGIYEHFLDALQDLPVRPGVHWTSSPGQVDVAQEAALLAKVLEDRRVHYRTFANPELAAALAGRLANVHYLPDTVVLPPEPPPRATPRDDSRECFAISLFCSPFEYKRKNVLSCLLALAGLEGDYVLHLNGLSQEPPYRTLLTLLKIRHEDFGWMEQEAYERALERIDLGLQVSLAETFNHVVAEHIARGIPVLTSRMVPVMDSMPAAARARLVVEDPESPGEIRSRIEWAMSERAACGALGAEMRSELRLENDRRIEAATAVLDRIVA